MSFRQKPFPFLLLSVARRGVPCALSTSLNPCDDDDDEEGHSATTVQLGRPSNHKAA